MSTTNPKNGGLQDQTQTTTLNGGVVLTIALVLLFIALVVVFLHFYVRYLLRRPRRDVNTFNIFFTPGSSQTPRPGLDPAIVASLPTLAYQKCTTSDAKEEDESSKECVVCLSVFEDGEKVRELPNCKHVFHVACIDKWLHENSTCPVCRTNAEPAAVGEASGSKEVGSTSSRRSSFRRIITRDWPGGRIQPAGAGGERERDLERQ